MIYVVEANRCNCHPETCCCDDYKIVDNKGVLYVTIDSLQTANEIVDLLNKAK